MITGTLTGVLIGLIFGAIWFVTGLPPDMGLNGLPAAIIAGVYAGVIAGVIFGIRYGGSICILHFMLRIAFRKNDFAPLDYVKFLDYAADRIFLRKVGGGYMFIHPMMIKDYFASLEPD